MVNKKQDNMLKDKIQQQFDKYPDLRVFSFSILKACPKRGKQSL